MGDNFVPDAPEIDQEWVPISEATEKAPATEAAAETENWDQPATTGGEAATTQDWADTGNDDWGSSANNQDWS